jgi:quercetin dioxygenase-like cupin family protein
MAGDPTVLIYDEIEWDDVMKTAARGKAPPPELVAQAKKTGARRKKLARGEGGFFMNRSVLPAGFRVPPHTHDHDELMIVLSGDCFFDDDVAELGIDDSIVIRAHFRYGFTCGPDGMEFLTIRTGEAGMSTD